jgi:predicted acetylornithine/succinylornithine family transaminase
VPISRLARAAAAPRLPEDAMSQDTKTLLDWADRYLMHNYARAPICLVRGEGARVWDTDGREYLDFVGGIAVGALGHCHPKIVGAIREQATALLQVSNLYQIPSQIHLAKLLCEHSFADRAFFCNSGTEANEAAIKLARKHATDTGSSDRTDIITMRGAFHGRTMGALSATPNDKYQRGFHPLVPGFKHVPFGDLRAAERAMDGRTAAILVEPIQGEGGVNVAPDGYLAGLRRLCDAHGALLMFDEVQTGMGRTGRLWAHEHWGVTPDVMTLAKALASGVPIGAMLARESCARAMTAGTHGTTFGGNPFATTIGVATFTTMIEEKLPERAERLGSHLLDRLRSLGLPAIKGVRGKGLLVGVDLDRAAGDVVTGCRQQGLLVLTSGEAVLRMTPPLVVGEGDIDRAVEIVRTVLARGAS